VPNNNRKKCKANKIEKDRTNHFKKRVRERYNLELSKNDLEKIISLIKEGNAIFIERISWTRQKYLVEFRGQKLCLVYSSTQENLVTALPFEGLGYFLESAIKPLDENWLKQAAIEVRKLRQPPGVMFRKRHSRRFTQWTVSALGVEREIIYDNIKKIALSPKDFLK